MEAASKILMSFQMGPLEGDVAEATEKHWLEQMEDFTEPEDIVLLSNYERLLDWTLKHTNGKDDGLVYGLVNPDRGYAQAIVELTHARPHSNSPWLKLLDIHLEPRLDVDNREEINSEYYKEVFAVLTATITLSLGKTFNDHPARQLKVYGRTSEMRGLFDAFVAISNEENIPVPNLRVKRQGRWLVFDKP